MPNFGDKARSYPFGYGYCQCGCNKITQMSRSSSGEEWVWDLYCEGHGPLRETTNTPSRLNNAVPESSEDSAAFIRANSPVSADPGPVIIQDGRTATLRAHNGQQIVHNPVRERLTKLFEFLRAYVDLRFPPARNITQQPQYLWLNELPAHPSVELFQDAAKSVDDVENNNDIVLRLTRPVITECPHPPAELVEWLHPGWPLPR